MRINEYSEYETTAINAIDEKSEALRDISLKIHENPELSDIDILLNFSHYLAYNEEFAHNLLVEYLEGQGFKVTRSAYGLKTAFSAEFSSEGGNKRVVSFNSEYDALPGIGHACGHNLIAISGVAAAIALKAVFEKHKIPGKVKLLGTPAEETGFAKIDMIKAGAYDDVGVSLMVHPSMLDGAFFNFLAVESCEVEYFGRAAHASASPWEGINALDAMVLAYSSIGLLRQQTLHTNRIHGIITDGGKAPNIIPDHTSGKFYIRGKTVEDLRALKPHVYKCFEAAAEATGCTKANGTRDPVITRNKEIFNLNINAPLGDRYEKHLRNFGINFPSKVDQTRSSGSTDQGNVTFVVPGIHPIYDIKPQGNANHTPAFADAAKTEFAHKATLTASKGIALTGLDFLIDDDFAKSVTDTFKDGNYGLHLKDVM